MCMQRALVYGSLTWAMKVTDMNSIRVTLNVDDDDDYYHDADQLITE